MKTLRLILLKFKGFLSQIPQNVQQSKSQKNNVKTNGRSFPKRNRTESEKIKRKLCTSVQGMNFYLFIKN